MKSFITVPASDFTKLVVSLAKPFGPESTDYGLINIFCLSDNQKQQWLTNNLRKVCKNLEINFFGCFKANFFKVGDVALPLKYFAYACATKLIKVVAKKQKLWKSPWAFSWLH